MAKHKFTILDFDNRLNEVRNQYQPPKAEPSPTLSGQDIQETMVNDTGLLLAKIQQRLRGNGEKPLL